MDKTILEIPTELLEAARITPEEAKKELAIRLYQLHKLNDKQPGELAGDPKAIEMLVWSNGEVGHFDLNDFLSWASHDLKTPLNSVIGFTKVVLKGIDGPVNAMQETDLSTAFTAGQRMLKTNNVKGTACLHLDFFDSHGGSLYHAITEMPSGNLFTGTHGWTHDVFEAKVPSRTTYAELRIYINDSGKVFIRNVMMNRI